MSYSFDNALDKANEAFPRTSYSNVDYFNIEDGNDNVCRVLTPGAPYATHFMGKGVKPPVCYGYQKGCPAREKNESTGEFTNQHAKTSIRFVLFVLDRKDNKVKTAFFPYSVTKQIGALQKNPDYEFDDLPMPYDIRITSNKEGGPFDKYRVEYKPNGAELTEDQKSELTSKIEKMSPEDIAERMKEKQYESDDRSGRRIGSEELAKQQKEFLAQAKADEPKDAKAMNETSVEYPTEEINPEDIPF